MQALISTTIALIMVGIGLSIKWDDLRQLFKNKRSILLGLVLQMLFLPLLAFLVAFCSGLSPEFKVGLFIVSICPGGTTSNFISYIVKADVALSIFLTCVNSILILITIPILTNLSLDIFMSEAHDISILSTFKQVFLVLFIPVLLGIFINEKVNIIDKIKNPLRYFNTILLGLVFGIKYFADESNGGSSLSIDNIIHLLPYCIFVHFTSMMVSYFMAKKTLDNNLKAVTIGIEVGLQNTALALLITGEIIKNNEMTKPALVIALFSFFTTFIFALKYKNNK